MSKKDNVISLEERRRQAAGQMTGDSSGNAATVETPGRETTVPENTVPENTVPGRLIWLHCPTCDTLEYTEMALGGGRVHNVCGTHVAEAEVELDLRAEHTIARINLERLSILENLLSEQRRKFEEYLQRLSLAAGKPLEEYSFSEALLEKLPIAEVDAFGLLISNFFHQVEGFFSTGDKLPAGETAAPLSNEDGPSTPTDD
ncbi:MAG: hypothetical protein V3S64_15255 [bacterium]